MLVLPVPGASTGIGVSSPCRTSEAPITSRRRSSVSGCSVAAVAPSQPESVEGRQIDPVARVDLGLAIQRKMVVELRHRDVGRSPGPARPRGTAWW